MQGLVVVLVALMLAAPWLGTWAGLLRVDEGTGVVASPEVVRLRPELVLLPGGRYMMGSPTRLRRARAARSRSPRPGLGRLDPNLARDVSSQARRAAAAGAS